MDLVEFSSKLSDSVTSIRALGSTDYLNSPELRKEILRKVPESMLQDFARFGAAESDEISELEKLAAFMLKESKIASKAGIIGLHRDDNNINERKSKSSRVTNANQKAVFSLQAHEPQIVDEFDNGISNVSKCAFCGRSNHTISLCRDFMRESRQERWKIVRRLKLCYNCLKQNHLRGECNEKICEKCGRRHHTLLHFMPTNQSLSQTETKNNSKKSLPVVNSVSKTVLTNNPL